MFINSLNKITYPYAVLSDIHCHNWSAFSYTNEHGVNNRLQHILDGISYAVKCLRAANGSSLVITGDLFHTRGNIKPSVFNPIFDLFNDITASGIEVHALPGNHDLEGKDSDRLGNAFTALSGLKGFHVYDKPTYLASNHLFLPWNENYQAILNLAKEKGREKPNLTVFCHVGLNEVIPANIGHTLDPKEFLKEDFKYVFCGHFHNHVSFDSRVYSVGALTHQTWGDVGSKAGFLIVHEDKVIHHETKAPKFVDIINGKHMGLLKGNYIRIKDVEFTDDEAADYIEKVKSNGALAVLDQSNRPTIKVKSYEKEVNVDLGLDFAIKAYCENNFGEHSEKVLEECLKLKS